MAEYFSTESLGLYDFLIPTKLPIESSASLNYGLQSIRRISSDLGYKPNEIVDQWQLFIPSLIDSTEFSAMRQADPAIFWSKILCLDHLPWTEDLKALIRKVLVLPIGSADAERGFSILKHTRYDRRSLLTADTLDALLRIRINGPNIEDFNAVKYARLWEKAGHILTDSAAQVRSDDADTNEEPDEEFEILPDPGSGKYTGKKYFLLSNLF